MSPERSVSLHRLRLARAAQEERGDDSRMSRKMSIKSEWAAKISSDRKGFEYLSVVSCVCSCSLLVARDQSGHTGCYLRFLGSSPSPPPPPFNFASICVQKQRHTFALATCTLVFLKCSKTSSGCCYKCCDMSVPVQCTVCIVTFAFFCMRVCMCEESHAVTVFKYQQSGVPESVHIGRGIDER